MYRIIFRVYIDVSTLLILLYADCSLCEMCRSKNCIVRNWERDYISLIIDAEADHESVIAKAANLLHLEPEKCSLVHLNGCRIMNSEIIDNDGSHGWSIG